MLAALAVIGSFLGNVLKRVPWWLWIILIIAVVIGVKEYRDQQKMAALQRELNAVREQAVEQAKQQVQTDIKALSDKSSAIKQSVEAIQREVARSEARIAGFNRTLTQLAKDRAALVEHGTVDDVVRAGRALGYHPEPAVRPR